MKIQVNKIDKKEKIEGIQIFRGLLFLLILAYHSNCPIASFGWWGVVAFFTISSFFLVSKYYGTNTLNVKQQLKYRFKRLSPPYYVVVLFAVLFTILIKKFPYDLLPHLLYFQNFYWMITDYKSPMQFITAHTWTMSIEFYTGLIMSILLHNLMHKNFKKYMYIMILMGVFYRIITIIMGYSPYITSLCPVSYFDTFAIGALLAIDINKKKLNKKHTYILILTGIIGILLVLSVLLSNNGYDFEKTYTLIYNQNNFLGNILTGNIYIFISILTAGIVGMIYINSNKEKIHKRKYNFLLYLGNNSYILYLFHWPILMVVSRIINVWYFKIILTLIISLISAYVFNLLYSRVKLLFIK